MDIVLFEKGFEKRSTEFVSPDTESTKCRSMTALPS